MSRAKRILWFFATALAVLSGCRGATICEPPGGTSGLFVRVHNSDAYVKQVTRADSEVPHVACRATADIPVQRRMWQESSSAQFSRRGGPQSSYDARVLMVDKAVNSVVGYWRVLGLGRGIDADDCGTAALQACNEAIDRYWEKELAVRPLDVGCKLAVDRERCPGPGGSFEPVALAAEEPVPAPRTEPPLVTLVKKLDDARTRRDAVHGLAQFFDNAKTRAGGDVKAPAVVALLDQIVEPLSKAYGSDLDEKTRARLIRLLAETLDVRAGRAWNQALTSYAPGKPGGEEDVRWAALAIGSTRYQEGASALGEAFGKIDASTPEGDEARKNVVTAMVALKSASWKAMLVERLRRPLPNDDDVSSARRSESFWQSKAAEILAEIGDPGATEPLLGVLVDSDKAEVAPAALEALVRLGEAGKLSPAAGAKKAYIGAYEKLSRGSTLARPDGTGWRPALLTAAAGFGDAELVPWLLKQAKSAKGAEAEQVRAAALSSAVKSMRRRDVPAVKAAVEKLGTAKDKDALRAALENVAE
jgi:HEAT repeat protein